MEFWADRVVEKSWQVLLDLNEEYEFILIGGWANYLHTGSIRSKDIDIVVDFETLEQLKTSHDLKKNNNLKKYEIVVEEISVDIYVPYFSELLVPVEDLENYVERTEGIQILSSEALLVLKQGAAEDRSHSVKGQKDRADILNLLVNSDLNLEKYGEILAEYGLEDYRKKLLKIVRNAQKEFEYLDIEDPGEVKRLKNEIVEKLRRL
ncbi:MAG: hypothetical protein ACLFQ8_02405 [Candidatus Aenigmatarchaeota archaeon]